MEELEPAAAVGHAAGGGPAAGSRTHSLTHQEDASRLSVLNINCRSVRLNQHHRIRSLVLLPPTAHD